MKERNVINLISPRENSSPITYMLPRRIFLELRHAFPETSQSDSDFRLFDFLFERVDSPGSYIRLVYFSPGSNFWVTNCCCTSTLVEGETGTVPWGGDGKGRVVSLSSPAPPLPSRRYVTIWRVALRGDAVAWRGHASCKGSRVAEKVDQYQAKRSAPLPTSVATRATTRPARCSRIDFVNPTWETATQALLLLINYKSSPLEFPLLAGSKFECIHVYAYFTWYRKFMTYNLNYNSKMYVGKKWATEESFYNFLFRLIYISLFLQLYFALIPWQSESGFSPFYSEGFSFSSMLYFFWIGISCWSFFYMAPYPFYCFFLFLFNFTWKRSYGKIPAIKK